MNDPAQEILDVFYNMLHGNVSYSGDDIPVYKMAPGNEYDFIHLRDILLINDNTKNAYHSDGEIIIDVITSQQSRGQTSKANNIVNQVLNIVIASNPSMTGFSFSVLPYLSNSMQITESANNMVIFRRILTISYKVEQI